MQQEMIELQSDLELRLEQISQVSDRLQRNAASLYEVEQSIEKVMTFIRVYQFNSTSEEVNYFKTQAPYFYSKYLYFRKVQQLEILKQNGSSENTKQVLLGELALIDHFINDNSDFFSKYYQGSNFLDELMFTKEKSGDNWILNHYSPELEKNFSTATTKIATLFANEKIRCYVDHELEKLANPEKPRTDIVRGDFGWGKTKAAAAELFNKLAEKKAILYKGEPADKKRVTEFVKFALNIDLGNFYEVNRKNKTRKKDQFPFLRSLLDESTSELSE